MVSVRTVSALTAAVVATVALGSAVHGDVLASDNLTATNAAYAPDATPTAADALNGVNGGSGFGAWVVTETGGSGAGSAYASSVNNNTNDAGNAATRNPPPVFDLVDTGGTRITASRSMASMTAGSSFSFWQTLHNLNNATANGSTGTAGFQLLDSAGSVLFDLHISGGGPGWVLTDANNTGLLMAATDTGHPGRTLDYNFEDSDSISIQLLDLTTLANGHAGADYQVVSGGHRGDTFGTIPGTQVLQIDMSTGGPVAFDFYNDNGGAGSDFAVNNLVESGTAPVPEPASLAIAGVGVSALLMRRRRGR